MSCKLINKLKPTVHTFKLEDYFKHKTNNSWVEAVVLKKNAQNRLSLSPSTFVFLICKHCASECAFMKVGMEEWKAAGEIIFWPLMKKSE